jgi:mycofactocin precursor
MVAKTAPTADAPTRPDGAPAIAPAATPEPEARPASTLVEADLLVEDVSIDGMCGVY